MLSVKKVIHIDLNSLYVEMTAAGENIPPTFTKFLIEIGCDDLQWGDVRSILFSGYTEESKVIKTIQDYLSFYHNIYDNEICLEMNVIAMY
jgi:hypothetical protein